MKDQVPVVLLNQWLDIQPEKSGFAKIENWKLNADEYSVFSDETKSNYLSINNINLNDLLKRKSTLLLNSMNINNVRGFI